MTQPFIIGICGDTGFDTCEWPVERPPAQSPSRRRMPYKQEFSVPSGAQFLRVAFEAIFDRDPTVRALHFQPREASGQDRFSTMENTRIVLDRYPKLSEHAGGRVLRISRTEVVKPERPVVPRERFDELIATSLATPSTSGSKHDPTHEIQLLVIHDGAGRWRETVHDSASRISSADERPPSALELVRRVLQRDHVAFPRVVVNVDSELPKLMGGPLSDKRTLRFRHPIWNLLLDHADKVCVTCSSRLLRHEDAAISRHLSWEQSVEDLALEIHRFPPLRALAQFQHLVIRFGLVAALHVERGDEDGGHGCPRRANLVFAPLARDAVYRDQRELGEVKGYKVLIAAALAKGFAKAWVDPAANDPVSFTSHIRNGLLACMYAFDAGYDASADPINGARLVRDNMEKGRDAIQQGYENLAIESHNGKPRIRRDQTLGIAPIPSSVMSVSSSSLVRHHDLRRGEDRWEILRTALESQCPSDDSPEESTSTSLSMRINIATAVALFGHEAVLNRNLSQSAEAPFESILRRGEWISHAGDSSDCITLALDRLPALPCSPPVGQPVGTPRDLPPGVYVPVIEFGRLVLIERTEIESFRSARNAIRDYAKQYGREKTKGRPISIAVFGPPGSGKSFAIRQIVENVNQSLPDMPRKLEIVEFNVAQFRSVADLESAADRLASKNNDNVTPVAFFDEFDSSMGTDRLGWLKYFLAPMQEGIFYGTSRTILFGPAIFVFGGGLFHRFDEFAAPSADHHPRTRGELDGESDLRHQDFREKKGPDFVSRLLGHIDILPIDRSPGMYKFVIRRAILLRSLLQAKGVIVDRTEYKEANIDEDVLHALLTIDRYRHGVRSMEAIVRMCSPIDGRIEKASLPSRAQMAMHVDAEAFVILMNRGRLRRLEGRGSDAAWGVNAILPQTSDGTPNFTSGAPPHASQPNETSDVSQSDSNDEPTELSGS